MNKDIKDYLHLYLGCDVRIARPNGSTVEKLTAGRLYDLETYIPNSWDLHKPILRPLSDMTEEEKSEFRFLYDGHTDNILPEIKTGRLTNAFLSKQSPNMILFLLKKDFDLFDLIESGLAIDKSKTSEQ